MQVLGGVGLGRVPDPDLPPRGLVHQVRGPHHRLEDEQHARLSILAKLSDQSVTDVIRTAIDERLVHLASAPDVSARAETLGAEVFTDMNKGLEGVDIVMMLRLQRERMNGSYVPSTREFFHFFGLDHEKLARAKPDALIMHPGPMNRGVEIASTIADHSRSVIRDQVEMGVAVRMAVLEALARLLPNH